MRSLALGLVAAAALASGCASRAKAPELPAVLREFERDPSRFIAHVAKIRGLSVKRTPRIVLHDRASFARALEQELATDDGPASAADAQAFFSSFGLAAPSRSAGNTPADVAREQVIAFYDDRTHAVHVRRPSTLAIDEQRTAALVWAHEIGHALQHDNFQIPRLSQITDDDTFLASMALLEGDAMLVMLAYASVEERVPLKRTLVRANDSVARGDFDQYLYAAGDSKVLMRASPLVRERLMFPYLGGMRFMGLLHRAGGFPLVDRAYEHPPLTTEQVLHPEKYLAGEAAIEVPAPAPLDGFERLGSGRMGELQTRVVLEACNARPVARAAAEGWGGDAFTIGRNRDGRLALAWATAWDSPADAEEFERAISASARCWQRPSTAEDVLFSPSFSIVRREAHVAVVRGLEAPQAVTGALLDLPRPSPVPSPPFGAITIPPVRRAPPTHPPYVAEGRYVNQRLGIMAPVLPGYGVTVETDGTLSMTRSYPAPASGYIGLSEWVVSPSAVDATFRHFAESVQHAVADVSNGELRIVADPGRVATPLGTAVERVWAIDRSDVRIRLLMLPICGGTGSLLFAQLWVDDAAKAELDWWLGALRPLSDSAPPICAELDP